MTKSHSSKPHKGSNSSGSPMHRGEYRGPGPVAGAGEYAAKGPGKMGGGMADDMYPSAKVPAAQKSVPNRTRGQEEDGD